MNLNVKLDGEEDQSIQYMNRFAINIPSTAFNLNIVNPGLNNQSYILNPVNSVSQNIVAYQSPMAVQSYFALPTESDSNIIQSLPVGVPVPVGLPVQTGFLQNPNFVNTSIIIGNDECSSSGIVNSTTSNGDDGKPEYTNKPLEGTINVNDATNIGLNCSSRLAADTLVKKPCPLEMSIKAANIDIEFEKCEQEIPIIIENTQLEVIDGKLTADIINHCQSENVRLGEKAPPVGQPPQVALPNQSNHVKSKTEITWDSNSIKESVNANNFQESLICEVEEVNDEDDEGDEDSEDENEKSESEKESYQEDSGESSEESDSLPLSKALKLRKSSQKQKGKKGKKEKSSMDNKPGQNKEKIKGKKYRKVEFATGTGAGTATGDSDDEKWSDSDDDALNLKRIKNEFNYKCFFETKMKSPNSLILKIEDTSRKFVRVRGCCSKKECSRKISVKDQMAAYKHFTQLETNFQKDSYLINCIEHVQKSKLKDLQNKNAADDKNVNCLKKLENEKFVQSSNIQLDIENESNGNKKLSDEIQHAINESLKDCIDIGAQTKETSFGGDCTECPNSDKEEKNNWNYYIVVEEKRTKVCLQFLLKLLRITKTRIKQLQKKILSGSPLTEEPKLDDVWEIAKAHLNSVPAQESYKCTATPRHRYFSNNCSKEELFANFKEFFLGRSGKESSLKFTAYKRFLDKDNSVSFLPNKNDICTACEVLKARKKSGKHSRDSLKCENKKKKKDELDLCHSNDELESESKRPKLLGPVKGNRGNLNKSQANKNMTKSNKSKTKVTKEKSSGYSSSRQSSSKGRDVWSLMLLHLETMPYKECNSCNNTKKHRFLNSTFTTQELYQDYRKYFLKETNSELGLVFTMYEKYFNRNCNYTIMDISDHEPKCPRCIADQSRS